MSERQVEGDGIGGDIHDVRPLVDSLSSAVDVRSALAAAETLVVTLDRDDVR